MGAGAVLFVCNAGPLVGGGHVMRSLTLARALISQGRRCVFLAPPAVAELLEAFGGEDVQQLPCEAPRDAGELVQAAEARAGGEGFDGLVIDHYDLGGELDARLGALARAVLVLEDRAEGPRVGDLLLDPGLGRTDADYLPRTPPGTELLLGPSYALVGRDFAQQRRAGMAPLRGQVETVLLSLGLTDVGGVTAEVLDLLAASGFEGRCIVAVGSAAPSVRALERRARSNARIELHVNARNVAELMARADVAVGAGGSSVWERACLGLASLTVVVADNQLPQSTGMAEAGASLFVDRREPGFEDAFAAHWSRLVADADLRTGLRSRSAALCDGRGAERAAERFGAAIAP